jgi:hypothetical protein
MNNKYDVKNFSDLIDQFKVEDEMLVLNEELKARKETPDRNFTIFDPFITDSGAKYEFAGYTHRRYDLNDLS